jgi:hypothetical protein
MFEVLVNAVGRLIAIILVSLLLPCFSLLTEFVFHTILTKQPEQLQPVLGLYGEFHDLLWWIIGGISSALRVALRGLFCLGTPAADTEAQEERTAPAGVEMGLQTIPEEEEDLDLSTYPVSRAPVTISLR